MPLDIRKITEKDLVLIYEWANDPIVRSQSFNTELISLESHSEWFKRKLADDNCYFYMILNDSKPMGQIRFDLLEGIAMISYSISKNFRGQGYGNEMLRVAINQFNGECLYCRNIYAKVKSENNASTKIFNNLGFSLDKKSDDSSLLYILDNN